MPREEGVDLDRPPRKSEARAQYAVLAQMSGNLLEYVLSGPGILAPRHFVHEGLAEEMRRLCEEVAAYHAGLHGKRPPRRVAYHQLRGLRPGRWPEND